MKKILVTGGAGYIGSHTVAQLQKEGYEVVVFDNLVYGHKEAVKTKLIVGDLLDAKKIKDVFKKERFDGVIHFAAYALAGESMQTPSKYFENNLQGGVNLLEAMKETGASALVFSSTCAIYGFPKKLPVTENSEKAPVSVYGESKLMFEKILSWYDELFGIKSVCLRYFNASGAALDGSIGEDHSPETHIIPNAVLTSLGKRKEFVLFGDDYKTKDGSCVRDYIHVLDLASAHILSLEYLFGGAESNFFNVGSGQGYSNKEILNAIGKVAGKPLKYKLAERRPGDPDAIYADNKKIVETLGWKPGYSDLKTIVSSAYKWHREHPDGYK